MFTGPHLRPSLCNAKKSKQERRLIQTESPEGSTTPRAERMKGRGRIYTLFAFDSICEVWSVLSKFLATIDPGAENSSPAKKKKA